MRRISAEMESAGALRFVLLIGLVAGAIQGVPTLLLGGASTVGFHLVPFLVIGIAAITWWVGALLLWWIAVRRRQSSLLAIAGQVTLGLILADIFANALGMVGASIETHGAFAAAISHQLGNVILSNLSFTLAPSPFWYLGAALAIALGRRWTAETQPQATSIAAS